jgi:hypothetical protein
MHQRLTNYFLPLLLTIGLLPNLSAQNLRTEVVSALGVSSQVGNSNLIMQQSIGQTTVIGSFTHAKTTLAQGFLRGVYPIQRNPEVPFDVLAFPNSFSSTITLKFIQMNSAQTYVSIYDLNGKRVFYKGSIPIENELQLHLEHLKAGVYLTFIQTGNRIIQKRILKVD